MLFKRQVRNKIFDRLHRGTVMVCMGVTVISTLNLCYFGYQYFVQIKPQKKLEQLKFIQEGAHDRENTKTLVT